MARQLRQTWGSSALLALAIVCGGALAQGYPVKPVRLVNPFPAGGSSDTISRIVGQKLGAAIGQTVVLDNRPGAGGNLGAELVAKAPPDGYVLLVVLASHAINATLYKGLTYDLVKDFEPVIQLCSVTGILVAHPSLPVKSARELVAMAKARPGQLNFASAGSGTVTHLAGELFKTMVGVNLVHVPYRGSGPALIDVLGGQVPLMFANMPGTIQHVQSGKLRVLGVNSLKRSTLLPGVPTVAESGVPGFEASTWFGVLAPARTPREIVARLNADIARSLNAPDMAERFNEEGAVAAGGPPEQFGAFIRAEIEKWSKIVRASGARVD